MRKPIDLALISVKCHLALPVLGGLETKFVGAVCGKVVTTLCAVKRVNLEAETDGSLWIMHYSNPAWSS